MQEQYHTYRERVGRLVENRACFPPEWECFGTAEGLKQKFDGEGNVRAFYGDTTVFPLPATAISQLETLQAVLYRCAGYMLSEQLPPETFHITLHDLSAGNTEESVADALKEHGKLIAPVLDNIHQGGGVRLRSVGIVSMVASSLVMLFEPVSDCDHRTIQRIYHEVDRLRPLSYPLTLHCTLAYYRPAVYSPEQWNGLLQKVTELNRRESIELELDCSTLEYQYFHSMKHYFTIGQ